MAGTIKRGKITRADLANWDGKTSTYTRTDATGGTVTGLAIGNAVDVLQVFGSGTEYSRATIAAAVAHIGSTAATLVFAPGTWTIDDNLTIPSNLTCRIPAGCVFDVSDSKTLTISGLAVVERPASWTTGSGTVTATNTIPQVRTAAEIAGSVTPSQHAYHEADPRRYSTSFAATYVTDRNTPWGYHAFQNATPGVLNTAIGFEALKGATTGGGGTTNAQGNTAVGAQAMSGATETGDYNTAIGYLSLYAATSAYCTAVGCDVLKECTTSDNTGVGAKALLACTTGTPNTAVGTSALTALTTGTNNVAVGTQAGDAITIGTQNVAIGDLALTTLTDNSFCTAVGYWALRLNTAATNTAIGHKAMENNSTGTGNTAVGNQALDGNTEGDNNTAVGYGAMFSNTLGDQATAVGLDALYSSTGGLNTGVGYFAGRATTTGTFCTFIGRTAGQANTTGSNHVALGDGALDTITTGNNCTAIGFQALDAATGSANTAVGYQALAGLTTETNCSGLGASTAVSGSNQVQLGDSATTTYAYGAVQDRSDERDKADIRDTALGLDFILALRSVDFRRDYREDYGWNKKDNSRKRTRFHHGFTAQSVRDAMRRLGVDFGGFQDHSINGGKDVLSLGYTEFIAPLVKGMQELHQFNQQLQKRIEKLEAA
jgi:hypothetical protein